ncbi:MAG: FlgD immunoglobulin-like domain containing protein [Candidatus Latescibacterota bacterium]
MGTSTCWQGRTRDGGELLVGDVSGDGQADLVLVRRDRLHEGLHVWLNQGHGSTAVASEPAGVPRAWRVGEAWPNPFNPETRRALEAPGGGGAVRVEVFDVLGRRVATLLAGEVPGGRHEVRWDGRDAAGREAGAATYLCRVQTPVGIMLRKLAKVQ